jgi:acetyl-CoA carboxylase carboxyl transferase subunit beta
MIVDRRELRERIHRLLAMMTHFAPAVGKPH